ncbi:hypothetical protein COCMIDRAFT_27261 [Bipolaris oryzae ATCC 44560]|uniref:Uncharacterized protein n=1 Tax=Bipolaris oryzae ATCC 44560 TaxID=930090 RepID=W6Z3R4_COCMI|nr:uncharacterized protein COCMIDRAFT_27261 [Bipolaris oryzae ATCC 44560]EUC44383.1 hypothetical protein COCMIDRAFT_27261 [Bipolaris oryzae ATCC 44560]
MHEAIACPKISTRKAAPRTGKLVDNNMLMGVIARQSTRDMMKFANPEAEIALRRSPRSVAMYVIRLFAATARDYGGFNSAHQRFRCGLYAINPVGQALLFGDDKNSYDNVAAEFEREDLYIREWRQHR